MDYISNHSTWAIITLILIFIAIINALIAVITKRKYRVVDNKITLYSLIALHIQIILGFASYMVSTITQVALQDIGTAMKESTLRLFTVEHPLVMIIAAIVITIGFNKSRKIEDDYLKFRTILIFYTVSFVLILSRIPWSSWG